MKEIPMLFNSQMVNVIMNGQKTQTRREVKGIALDWLDVGFTPEFVCSELGHEAGSIIWVRETWAYEYGGGYLYKASHAHITPGDKRWRPSIHMPRAAARIFLEVVDVRIERLLDISEDDARAEGCTDPGPLAIGEFLNLWDSINGKDCHLQNPWVWVVQFQRKWL